MHAPLAPPRAPFAAALASRLRREGGGSGGGGARARLGLALGAPAPAGGAPVAWAVAAFAQASRHPELRSLMLEASRCSTREAVRAALPAFWTGGGRGGGGAAAGGGGWLAGAQDFTQLRRAHVAVALLLALFAAVAAPRLALLGFA